MFDNDIGRICRMRGVEVDLLPANLGEWNSALPIADQKFAFIRGIRWKNRAI